MADSITPAVRAECRALTRHLIGMEPSDHIVDRYARGLESDTFREGLRRCSADRILETFGRAGPVGLSLADAWARFFAPAGEFRRRAVLLGAILESAPDTFAAYEPPPAGRGRAWLVLVGAGLLFGFRLIVAALTIGPLHLLARIRGGPETNAVKASAP